MDLAIENNFQVILNSTSKITLKEDTHETSPSFLTFTRNINKFDVNNTPNYIQMSNEYEVQLKHGSKIKSRLLNRNWSNLRKFRNMAKEEKRVNKQKVSISLTEFDFDKIKTNKNKHRFEHI